MVSHKIGLRRELVGYFGLFLIRFGKEGKLSGKKEERNAGQPETGGQMWAGAPPEDVGSQLRGQSPPREYPHVPRSLLDSGPLDTWEWEVVPLFRMSGGEQHQRGSMVRSKTPVLSSN